MAAEVECLEAHGTGTALGDPTEAGALAAVHGARVGASVVVGAAKANVGHSEAASGQVGLLKVQGLLENESCSANAHICAYSQLSCGRPGQYEYPI